MTKPARQEYTAAIRGRYLAADRAGKRQILDEYCRTLRCHRKAAIRAVRRPPGARRCAGRAVTYDRAVVPVLDRLWRVSDRRCGKLLAPALRTLLPALERHGYRLAPTHRAALLALSPATIDRLLQPSRARAGRQPYRVHAAARALKQQIPVRTWGEWRGVRPGAVQGDLVLHGGESTAGFYLSSLVGVDVASGWIELEAVWGVGAGRVGAGIDHLRRRLPVPLREWHTDNGREFLNHGLVAYCRRHGIHFTRGRDYRKNDQAWVELRNWLIVRRLVGRDRYSSRAAYHLLQRLYTLVRVPVNFFRPFRKLLAGRRVGSKRVRRYDAAQTPLSAPARRGRAPRPRPPGAGRPIPRCGPRALGPADQRHPRPPLGPRRLPPAAAPRSSRVTQL